MSEIILSICLSGRNDNYGFNFKYRFVQAMNFLAWSAKRASVYDQIEVVFTDWNSEKPLAQEICLSEDASKMVRFVVVPPEIAKKYNPSFSPFSQSVAFNAAFRRAKGKYIGLMPADVLLPSHSLRNLIHILSGDYPVDFSLDKAVFAVPRKNVPFSLNEGAYFTSPKAIEHLLLSGSAYMLTDNLPRGMMGGYGAFFLNREQLFSLWGADERIDGWGYNDIDLALRASVHSQVINMSGYGVWSYDFEPSRKMDNQKQSRLAKVNAIKFGTAENTENWGLGEITLPEMYAQCGTNKDLHYASADPEGISYRDWIAYLLHQVPRSVKKISSCALAAAQISLQNKVKSITLIGANDISIPVILSLYNSFPELKIYQTLSDEEAFFALWRYDITLGPLHYQGPVSYIPSFHIMEHLPEMIICDSVIPDFEDLAKHISERTILLLSKCTVSEEQLNFLKSEFPLQCLRVSDLVILAREEVLEKTDPKEFRPFKGSLIFSLINSLFPDFRILKNQKLMRLISRIRFLNWIKMVRIFQYIRYK